MTIKEIEREAGMTRANIRYYESEGLLAPVRGANGYREYSQQDLEGLRKIKLLRSLRFSLEEIKEFQSGKRELSQALDLQMNRLQQEKVQLEHSQEICQAMKDDGVRYQTLDAQYYLGILEHEEDWSVFSQQDIAPQIRIPWRRYFARSMDLLLYSVLWDIFLALVMGVNLTKGSAEGKIWDTIVPLFLMLLTEPLQLSLFGTTLGKWLLGLRVADNEGERLTLGESWTRTWKVLSRGMGFGIPVWSLFRLWKSYRACMEEETLEWEYDSSLTLKDEKGWRAAVYIGVCILLAAAYVLAFQTSTLPKNRGDITVAEFSENYNYLAKFYGYESVYCLDEAGKWIRDEGLGYGRVIVLGEQEPPKFQFTEKDGVMTGMRFSVEIQGNEDWIYGWQQEMLLSMLAFAGARKENRLFVRDMEEAVRLVEEAEGGSFELSVYGVRVVCKVAYSGYMAVPGFGMLVPEEGGECWYSLSFSMEKETAF